MFISMNDGEKNDSINKISVWRQFPPLIRGYLRLGSFVGDGAVKDYDYKTVDICIVLTKSRLNKFYYDRFIKNSMT